MKEHYSFVRNIYNYCDENIGEKILFPVFVNLWPENYCSISKKDLTEITSKLIKKLMNREEKILKDISNKKNFENVYGLYEILPHKELVRKNEVSDRK